MPVIVVGPRKSVRLMHGQDSSLALDLVLLCLLAKGGRGRLQRLWMSKAAESGLQFGWHDMYAVIIDNWMSYKAGDLRFDVGGARAK